MDDFGFWSDFSTEDKKRREQKIRAESEGILVPSRVWWQIGDQMIFVDSDRTTRVYLKPAPHNP